MVLRLVNILFNESNIVENMPASFYYYNNYYSSKLLPSSYLATAYDKILFLLL